MTTTTTTTIGGQEVSFRFHLTARDRALVVALLDHGHDEAVAVGTSRKRAQWTAPGTITITDAERDDFGRRGERVTVVTVQPERMTPDDHAITEDRSASAAPSPEEVAEDYAHVAQLDGEPPEDMRPWEERGPVEHTGPAFDSCPTCARCVCAQRMADGQDCRFCGDRHCSHHCDAPMSRRGLLPNGSPIIAGGSFELDEEPARLTTRERRENRAERRREWAESRKRKREAAVRAANAARDALPPMGEPIKVGHHSERHHRKAIERAHTTMERVVEHEGMIVKHSQAADAIETELDRSIYDDDSDAIERLVERIAELEAQRERMKLINRTIRAALKRGGGSLPGGALDALDLSERERTDLMNAAQFSPGPFKGYPSYALSNIGGNISRQRKRLERLRAA